MMQIDLIVTAAFGLESVVAGELKTLGYRDLRVQNGKVEFSADWMALCRANLWLRSAGRVLVKVGEFPATTFEELFERTKSLPWAEWLPANASFPVEASSVDSKLFSESDCQAIVKKAIVEALKAKYHVSWFPEDGPKYPVRLNLLKDIATLTLDSSGSGLHRRGYRKLVSQAPIRETLAAAMVLLSRWTPDQPLADPCCGSGTIPIEAAMVGLNLAPGLRREFAAEQWPNVPSELWSQAREEARDLARWERKVVITGSDIDPAVLNLARFHAREAGVDKYLRFETKAVANFRPKWDSGVVICNPPYGERLGERRQAEQVYRDLRRAFDRLKNWNFYILSSHPRFEQVFGREADKRRKLYNGRIRCYLYQYLAPTSSNRKPQRP